MSKKRDYRFDLMRVVICIFVIIIHTDGIWANMQGVPFELFRVFLFQCNGLFFMISGYYNLELSFDNSSDYKKFYVKRAKSVFIPYAILTFILSIWNVHIGGADITSKNVLIMFYNDLMHSNAKIHLWFMYSMIGLIISTPFLSKMVHSMSEKELKILWYIALGWNIVSIYLCADFGVKFSYNGWILQGWPIYYFSGYYYRHVIVNEKPKKWIVLSVFGYFATVIGRVMLPDYFFNSMDLSVVYILFTVGIFMFWDKCVVINNQRIKKMVGYISNHTLYIYIIHWSVLNFYEEKIINTNLSKSILIVAITFLTSFVFSIVLRYVIQKIISWGRIIVSKLVLIRLNGEG